jgi:sugar phosphate isomerase/epimerase
MQGDKHRIYPGDGILPLVILLKDLKSINYRGPLSLELFNRDHWKQDPAQVAKTGLQKILDLIREADKPGQA